MVRTQKPRYPPPPLYPASHSDIPAMIDLWIRANEPNLLYRIIAPSEEGRRKICKQLLQDTISGPLTTVMKAVDWKDESVVTAFAIWEKMYPSKTDPNEDIKPARMASQRVMGGLVLASKEEKTPLQKYLAAQQELIQNTWTKDVKHVELMVMMTDPVYQRRGIGSALLKWGHEFVAKENVPEFLSSSPYGFPLYRSLGWNVVADVKVDLKEWVDGGEGDCGWGVYRTRFMVRLTRIGDLCLLDEGTEL